MTVRIGKYNYQEEPLERRQSPRIHCEISALLISSLSRHQNFHIEGNLYNLGREGAFFVHPYPEVKLQPGDPVRIIFKIETCTFETEGRVIFPDVHSKGGCGIQFRNLDPESRGAIAEYVG